MRNRLADNDEHVNNGAINMNCRVFSTEQIPNQSHITSDAVTHYQTTCPGRSGIVIANSISAAEEIAARFNAAGVSAKPLLCSSSDADRMLILKQYRRGEISILVVLTVDLLLDFGIRTAEVVIMARRTASRHLYRRQISLVSRCQHIEPLIIDFVGNVTRHGHPNDPALAV